MQQVATENETSNSTEVRFYVKGPGYEHYLDELDAKLQAFRQVARRESSKRWSTYQRLFDRYLLLGEPQLEEASSAPGSRPPSPAARGPADNGLRQPLLADSLKQIQDHQPGAAQQLSLADASRRDGEKD